MPGAGPCNRASAQREAVYYQCQVYMSIGAPSIQGCFVVSGNTGTFEAGLVGRLHVADLRDMSTLRAAAGGWNVPAHRLLGPVEAGQSGILPLGPNILTTFVVNYAHQLNHANPLTGASARWGLMRVLWRFSPDMPCIRAELADCDCHGTDHDGFLRYMWLMDLWVWMV